MKPIYPTPLIAFVSLMLGCLLIGMGCEYGIRFGVYTMLVMNLTGLIFCIFGMIMLCVL